MSFTDPTILLPNLVGALLLVGSVIVATSCKKDSWVIFLLVGGILATFLAMIPRAYTEDVAMSRIPIII